MITDPEYIEAVRKKFAYIKEVGLTMPSEEERFKYIYSKLEEMSHDELLIIAHDTSSVNTYEDGISVASN